MRPLRVGDSEPIPTSSLKVFMLRVASLRARGRSDTFELGWKRSPKGTAEGAKPSEGTPIFAEMAVPGTVFEGTWSEVGFFDQPDVLRALNWREALSRDTLFDAVNRHSAAQLESQRQYAESASLALVHQSVSELAARLENVRREKRACILCLGWGGGVVARVAVQNTNDPAYRAIIERGRFFQTVHAGFPFPKTRRIVFLEDRPATLPGWVFFEVVG
jgi:CRISPR-associated protein Csm5